MTKPLPTVTQIAHRLTKRACFDASREDYIAGLSWYEEAHAFCCWLEMEYCLKSVENAAGVVAALSPGVNWEQNKKDAESICIDGLLATVSTYGPNKTKAHAIFSDVDPSIILGGKKVMAFYHCILNPSKSLHVCIDRHAARAALPKVSRAELAKILRRVGGYDHLAASYMLAASMCGLKPHQVQAIVWLWQRRQ